MRVHTFTLWAYLLTLASTSQRIQMPVLCLNGMYRQVNGTQVRHALKRPERFVVLCVTLNLTRRFRSLPPCLYAAVGLCVVFFMDRSRKNPSDEEAEEPQLKGNSPLTSPMVLTPSKYAVSLRAAAQHAFWSTSTEVLYFLGTLLAPFKRLTVEYGNVAWWLCTVPIQCRRCQSGQALCRLDIVMRMD